MDQKRYLADGPIKIKNIIDMYIQSEYSKEWERLVALHHGVFETYSVYLF